MNETKINPDNEARLRAALTRAYAAVPAPSDALGARLNVLVAAHEKKTARPVMNQKRRRAFGASFAAAVVLGVLTIAAIVGTTGPRLSPAYARIRTAVSNVRSAHLIEWTIGDDGGRVAEKRSWFWKGMWRTEQGGVTTLNRDGYQYEYTARTNVLRVSYAYERDPPTSLSALVEGLGRAGTQNRLRELGEVYVEDENGVGRRARKIQIDLPTDVQSVYDRHHKLFQTNPVRGERQFLYVDPATDLPFRTESEWDRGNGWKNFQTTQVRYDVPAPARLFALNFPRTARVQDEEARQQQAWRARLDQNPVRHTARDRTIALRDLTVNEMGQVFVLYTAGQGENGERDWEITLADGFGRQFTRVDGGPVGRDLPALASRFTFDGERLQADWFRVTAGPPITLDRAGGWVVALHLPGGETISLRPQVNNWASGPVPRFAPYQEFLVRSAPVFHEAARARALFFRNGGWKADKPIVEMYERGRYDPLNEALTWYRLAVRIMDEATELSGGPAPNHALDLYDMADVLAQLGRTREAAEVRQKAEIEDPDGSIERQQRHEQR